MFRIQKKKKNQPNKTGGQTLGSCSPHRSLPDTSPPAPGAALSPSYGSWGQLGAPWAPFHNNPRPRDAASQPLRSRGLPCAPPPGDSHGAKPLAPEPSCDCLQTALAGRTLEAALQNAPNPQSPHPPSPSPPLPAPRMRPWHLPTGLPLASRLQEQNPGDHRHSGTR